MNNCLSNNYSNKQALICQKVNMKKALRESGYKNVSLMYTDKKDKKQKRDHSHNMIWFNPPFNKNTSTNVAKRFLNLLDQHFPKSNKLHAILNRNTVKVSYCYMQNMSSMIKSHKKKVINKDDKESRSCNCRLKSEASNSRPTLIWSIAKKVLPDSNISKKCLLCLHEKLRIINYPRPEELLNKRSELISKCRHANKFLLCNYKTKH